MCETKNPTELLNTLVNLKCLLFSFPSGMPSSFLTMGLSLYFSEALFHHHEMEIVASSLPMSQALGEGINGEFRK